MFVILPFKYVRDELDAGRGSNACSDGSTGESMAKEKRAEQTKTADCSFPGVDNVLNIVVDIVIQKCVCLSGCQTVCATRVIYVYTDVQPI